MVTIQFRVINDAEESYSYMDSVRVPEEEVEDTVQSLEKWHHEVQVITALSSSLV